MNALDTYYDKQEEPTKSCLLYLRSFILEVDPRISETMKYGMPFFCFNDKMCFYLWVHKKHRWPYLGIVEGKSIQHPDLLQEKRARMKIFLVDPRKDIPLSKLVSIMAQVLAVYK